MKTIYISINAAERVCPSPYLSIYYLDVSTVISSLIKPATSKA